MSERDWSKRPAGIIDVSHAVWKWMDDAEREIYRLQAQIEALQNPWVPVETDFPNDGMEDAREVEIAFWDGCYMCRCFGGYTDYSWWIGDEPLETHGREVIAWRECSPLPPPPEQKPR